MLYFNKAALAGESRKSHHNVDSKCTLTLFSSHPSYNLSKYQNRERNLRCVFSQGIARESRVARRMCLWIWNRLLPLLCCGLTWERLNIRRKSFFSASSGALSICSAEYGVVKGVVSVEGEGAFLLPRTAGGERLRSLIILLLFLLFRATISSRWARVVRPHTRRKSTFFGEIHLGRWNITLTKKL